MNSALFDSTTFHLLELLEQVLEVATRLILHMQLLEHLFRFVQQGSHSLRVFHLSTRLLSLPARRAQNVPELFRRRVLRAVCSTTTKKIRPAYWQARGTFEIEDWPCMCMQCLANPQI